MIFSSDSHGHACSTHRAEQREADTPAQPDTTGFLLAIDHPNRPPVPPGARAGRMPG
jgi:hypothetical protein